MNVRLRICTVVCASGLALCALPRSAGAQTAPPVLTYLVTTIGGNAAGNVVEHEALSLERNGDAWRVAVANADGSMLSVPVRFTPDHQIASNSPDAGLTCYNMAMAVVARAHEPSAPPASVFLRFANSVVEIPLEVRATQTVGSALTTALQGTSRGVYSTADASLDAGIVVNATVEQNGDDLRGASFDEVQFVGSPSHIVGRSTCVLSRATRARATPT